MAGKSLYSQKGEGVKFVYKLVSLMQIPSKILECMICKQYMIRILNTGDESGFTKTKLCQPHLISFLRFGCPCFRETHMCTESTRFNIAFINSHGVLLLLLKWKHVAQGLGRWLGGLLHS